jgi:thiol-disulfide isomerase/thioredoxin
VGQLAPDFEIKNEQGKSTSLNALKGQVVYLDFWASWCGPCRQSFPWMNNLQSKYASKGFQVIAVNVDAKQEDAKKFLAQVQGNFKIVYDSNGLTPKLYGVKGMPTSYLIDKNGRVVFEHQGFNQSKTNLIEKEIEKLIEAK